MKVYTKAGDAGYTSLMDEKNVSKSDDRIRLLGSIDELTSNIGLVRSESKDSVLNEFLEQIQHKLMQFMAHVADRKNLMYFFEQSDITLLEKNIDQYEVSIIRQKNFILPGKCHLSAGLDVARTVARRAETHLTEVDKTYAIEPNSKKYINRLSDYLYIAARYVEFVESVEQAVVDAIKANLPQTVNNDITVNHNITDITLKIAKRLILEVEKKAMEMGLSAVIAVSNSAANPVAIHCMDDSYIASFDIALNKAYTSVAVKMSTIDLKAMSQPNQGLYGIQNTNNGKIIIFGGGVPLIHNGKIVGGLGVSGGSEENDTALAEYGRKLFKEVISWQ